MESYIYIDQNILSELRERKLCESKNTFLKALKELCKKDGNHLVYSETHLQEIKQIPSEEYQLEHIVLLSELNAFYITPISTDLSAKDPHLVWHEFLENENDNEALGINEIVTINDRVHRKLSGLPIEESFKELNEKLKESLINMLKNTEKEIENIDPTELSDEEKEAIQVTKEQMAGQLKSITEMVSIDADKDKVLGPKPLRDFDRLNALDLEKQPESEVINLIDELFVSENDKFKWSDVFDDTVHNQIARCYSLMNWVGYFADDFNSTKKKKDRFRASNNDLMHARNAAGCTILISNDGDFLKKTKACYVHLNIPTEVTNFNEMCNCL